MLDKKFISKIKNELNINSFYILKNHDYFDKNLLMKSLRFIKKNCIKKLDKNEDHKNLVKKPEEIFNYQRLLVGEYGNSETLRSFFFRQIINPIWAKNIYGLRDTFLKMIRIRNLLGDQDENFCTYKPSQNLYSLTRIQYYPSGGGFLSSHCDKRAEDVTKNSKINSYIQMLLLLTKKGEDFNTGGGYIISKNKRVIHDDFTDVGDIIIYNGNVMHGVETIDSHKQLNDDTKSLEGRFVLLCNLYNSSYLSKIKT